MKTLRTLLAVAALGAGLVACAGSAESEIEAVFKGYHEAELARDFPAVCEHIAPEAADKLLSAVATYGINARNCEEALAAIYAEPGAADTADAVSRSARIDDISVGGDEATITFTATLNGEPRQATIPLRRIDGDWKLVAAG